MAKIVHKNSKEKPQRSIKTFFPKNFKENILKEQKDVLLNAIRLYDSMGKIIRLFENKSIEPCDYPHNAKSELDKHDKVETFEPEEYDGVEEYEQKFEESIGERVKLRRQKKSDRKNVLNRFNEIIGREDQTIDK